MAGRKPSSISDSESVTPLNTPSVKRVPEDESFGWPSHHATKRQRADTLPSGTASSSLPDNVLAIKVCTLNTFITLKIYIIYFLICCFYFIFKENLHVYIEHIVFFNFVLKLYFKINFFVFVFVCLWYRM